MIRQAEALGRVVWTYITGASYAGTLVGDSCSLTIGCLNEKYY